MLGPEGVARLEEFALLGEMDEPCPYLPGETARFRFLDGGLSGVFFRELMDFGYRRNGQFIYRPVCRSCTACQVLRVPVATFKKTKEQRRIWNRGARHFTVSLARPEYTLEKAALYLRYQREVHGNERETLETTHYASFLVHTCVPEQTYEMQLRHDGALAGLAVVDLLDDALSSVYFFYDPDYRRYSLGTFSALAELAIAQRLGMAYYYPGYYIAGCRKMRYKARIRPCEARELDSPYWFPLSGEGERNS